MIAAYQNALRALALVALVTAIPGSALAQTVNDSAKPSLRPAAGGEVWASTDADGTDVVKVLGRALWDFDGKDDFAGIAVEHVWFSPAGGDSRHDDRLYLDIANRIGPEWKWKARIGTDGQTILGNAEVRRSDWSRTFFVEREIVETQEGLSSKIYYTFAGASLDLPIDPSNTLAISAGIQEFTGSNERIHLRSRYAHVVKADAGLSLQLDTRYYHSTAPNEFDYFSPKDLVRVLPLVQFRRFDDAGWMYMAAGGIGAQYSTGNGWQSARYAQLRLESPRSARNFDVFSEIIYTNDSISGGPNYDYVMGRAGVTFRP